MTRTATKITGGRTRTMRHSRTELLSLLHGMTDLFRWKVLNIPAHYLRINATLAQFEDFVRFYGISEGDGMYIAPKDRVAVR